MLYSHRLREFFELEVFELEFLYVYIYFFLFHFQYRVFFCFTLGNGWWWKFCNSLIFPSQFFNFPYHLFFIAVWNFILTAEIFFRFLFDFLACNSSPLPITFLYYSESNLVRDDENRIGFDLIKDFSPEKIFFIGILLCNIAPVIWRNKRIRGSPMFPVNLDFVQ